MAYVSPVLLILIAGVSFYLTGRRARELFRALPTARSEGRTDRPLERLKGVVVYVLGQRRLLRWPYPGILHTLIFWGFLVLLTAIAEAILEALFFGFRFDQVPLSGAVALLQDVFYVAVTVGVLMALGQRLFARPRRFLGSHAADAYLILGWILALVTAMELDYATRIAEGSPAALGAFRPVASLWARLFEPLGRSSLALTWLHGGFFWLHLALVFGFLVYLGYSKHLHIATAVMNVYFRNLEPAGRLSPLDLEAAMAVPDDQAVEFGVGRLAGFSWKDALDFYTCTECGRCQSLCPAFNTGKPLSPKTLITDLRDGVYEQLRGGPQGLTHHAHAVEARPEIEGAPVMWATGEGERGQAGPGGFQPSWIEPEAAAQALQGKPERALLGALIADQTLWSCTTCGACMDQCPVFIEHVPKIIDMRRHLVLDLSRMPRSAEVTLRNIESAANPYGLPPAARAEWARALGAPLAKDHPGAEYLYWLGCAASFDERARTVATALVRILQAAGVDFAVLGQEEKCTGDPARRIGNEYLFQERARENVETLKRHQVRKVIASCPHCFNSLANEYPDFGGDFQVFHHTQLIKSLLESGRLKLTRPLQETVTFHDSCYLGRWNQVFQPPRDILERIPGLKLVEMAQSRSTGMCCGAGGGRMWMEESKPRVNHVRVQQAAATEATRVATACPFCLGMFDEGIAAQDLGARLQVDDVAVYVAAALPD